MFVHNSGINPHSPKENKLQWVDAEQLKQLPEEMKNDKKVYHQFLITNDST